MAEKREKPAIDSQSQSRCSSSLLIAFDGVGENIVDDVLGQVLAPTAFKFAAHRGIGAGRVLAPAARGGADIAVPNHIARTDNHTGEHTR